MSTIITRGAASAQALGYAARTAAANYIEDVFSTYLYAGNGGTQTITNNVDLSTKGGLVWVKNRTLAAGHALTDTARGAGTGTNKSSTNILQTNDTGGTGGGLPAGSNDYLSAFTTTGFTVVSSNGANDGTKVTNRSSSNYVAWSFRKQAKFFDIVTYTGTGANRTISHSLGSVPGSIVIKRTDAASAWAVYHRSLANTEYMVLNTTAAKATGATYWNSTTPTSSVFSLGTATDVNANGGTYVAYLFAHDAGGFGASGSDNVISCGSFTTDGSGNATVSLGYEPQFIIDKPSSTTGNWDMFDVMRGWVANTSGTNQKLSSNLAGAEVASNYIFVNSTGFTVLGAAASTTYIYIAIRRGPMKTPTSGTSVYYGEWVQDVNNIITPNFPVDLAIDRYAYENDSQVAQTGSFYVYDRLRGSPANLVTNTTVAETTTQPPFFVTTTGFQSNTTLGIGPADGSLGNWYANFWTFRRAPGFFDVVCYTGTGATANFTHNLTVAPELMLIKRRSGAANWGVYASGIGSFTLQLNNANGKQADFNAYFANTNPTSSVFTVGSDADTNASASTYVAYLFSTLAGVSKVGTYTGNGSSQTINCGFTGGSRFVLIKRYDSTGNWTVFDSARGIVAGNDPALYLNSTAAEVTTVDAVDTDNSGFIVNQETTLNLNVNTASYVFLAIA